MHGVNTTGTVNLKSSLLPPESADAKALIAVGTRSGIAVFTAKGDSRDVDKCIGAAPAILCTT